MIKSYIKNKCVNFVQSHQISLYDNIIWYTFIFAHLIAFAYDLKLVFSGHISISADTWQIDIDHPTIMGAGILAYTGIARLVKKWTWMVFFSGIMLGHLFFHF